MSELELEKFLDNLNTNEFSYGLNKSIRSLKKEIVLYKKFINQKAKTKQTSSNIEIEKLQVGSGLHRLEGWSNLDLSFEADICWDIREGLPFDDKSVGIIFSEHTLEHLDYPVSVKLFYNEAFRVLIPGGKLIIGVPDAGLVLKKYLNHDKQFFDFMMKYWYKNRKSLQHFNTYIDLVNYVFRDEDDDDVYTPHFWAYDSDKLRQLARDTGFINIKKWKFDNTIANKKRKWASIYIVSEKPK